MSAMVQNNVEIYQPYLLPTYEDIKNFMEHGRNDEVDVRSHLGLKPIQNEAHDEDKLFKPTPSPPRHRDLVEILHR